MRYNCGPFFVSMRINYTDNRTFNPLAVGSNPTRPTKEIKGFKTLCPEALFSFLVQLSQIKPFCGTIAVHLMDKTGVEPTSPKEST